MGTYNPLGSPANYTIGGLRFFFDEIVSGVNQGYLYLGNVVTGALAPTVDNLDHFTAKSGKRLKDRRVVREVGMAFNVTLDEPNAAAMNLFMFGAGVSDVVAAPAVAVTDLPGIVEYHEGVIIPHKGATAITVTQGVTPAVLNTDYTIVDVLGYKKVLPKSGSLVLTAGAVMLIDYTYAKPAHQTFKPATRTLREGRAMIQGVSDIGNEFEYEIAYCSLAPNGEFSYNDQDWSQFQFTLEILDNSSVDVATPFGTIRHHGTGQDI
jgi:hypothetical protein